VCNWRERIGRLEEDILKVVARYPLLENDKKWVDGTVRWNGIIITIIIIMFGACRSKDQQTT